MARSADELKQAAVECGQRLHDAGQELSDAVNGELDENGIALAVSDAQAVIELYDQIVEELNGARKAQFVKTHEDTIDDMRDDLAELLKAEG